MMPDSRAMLMSWRERRRRQRAQLRLTSPATYTRRSIYAYACRYVMLHGYYAISSLILFFLVAMLFISKRCYCEYYAIGADWRGAGDARREYFASRSPPSKMLRVVTFLTSLAADGAMIFKTPPHFAPHASA